VIKLKIGDNYLITSNQDSRMKSYIVYMMGCFKQHGQTVLGLDLNHNKSPKRPFRNDASTRLHDYITFIKQERITDIWILTALPGYDKTIEQSSFKLELRLFLDDLRMAIPTIKYKVIKFNDKDDSREYKLSNTVYDALAFDDKSLISHLDKLDEYKQFANRYKAIPAELKVINESIKALSKERKVCSRKITLKDLEYLNMIQTAELEGDCIILTLKPMAIYTSEPMGKFIPEDDFRNNKYLYETAKHIYSGGHFGMVATRIRIRPDFKPEFIETLDNSFDDMFSVNNWSTIGYPHFGKNHFCGGEMNDVIAHTAEHGLEYFFMCLKQYLTTANIRDYAGRKVWWYPIYNDAGEMVYCAALDILKDFVANRREDESIRRMSIPQFLQWKRENNISFRDLNTNYTSSNTGSYNGKDDTFLKVLEEKDPALYEEIMKGANSNG